MWIKPKDLSAIAGCSVRKIQLLAKEGKIASRKIDGKSIEVDVDSLPPEWRTLVVTGPSVPAVFSEVGISDYAEK